MNEGQRKAKLIEEIFALYAEFPPDLQAEAVEAFKRIKNGATCEELIAEREQRG